MCYLNLLLFCARADADGVVIVFPQLVGAAAPNSERSSMYVCGTQYLFWRASDLLSHDIQSRMCRA